MVCPRSIIEDPLFWSRKSTVGQVTGVWSVSVLLPNIASFVLVTPAEFTSLELQSARSFSTCTTIDRLALAPGRSDPRGQFTFCATTLHPAAERTTRRCGRTSLIDTFCAAVVVLVFVAVSVYVKTRPGVAEVVEAVFRTITSASVGQVIVV